MSDNHELRLLALLRTLIRAVELSSAGERQQARKLLAGVAEDVDRIENEVLSR